MILDGKEKNTKKELPVNYIIIGNKEISAYLLPVLMRFETEREIILACSYGNISKTERIIKLLSSLSVEEIDRQRKDNNRMEVTIGR